MARESQWAARLDAEARRGFELKKRYEWSWVLS
ncbi:hypothetical protein PYK22_00759 [Pyrinomonas methylaliphatogenes]|uniref:Uncharacterized protein n=1 Tax=Pyrinomonas methylaliphatogenes TaxID=454194 RepID=A0A0B6WWU1_9BACT|nr:hypothetical protein PYK22_00759 [Pyrinomonas methylaliphatogenes]